MSEVDVLFTFVLVGVLVAEAIIYIMIGDEE